jgi:hypothetical protein
VGAAHAATNKTEARAEMPKNFIWVYLE